jgi:hypothetical protein
MEEVVRLVSRVLDRSCSPHTRAPLYVLVPP